MASWSAMLTEVWSVSTDYKTLHLKMKQYGIDSGQFKEFPA